MGQCLQKQTNSIEPEITELSEKQRGRALLIGKELESQVKRIIQELRVANGTVNTAIVLYGRLTPYRLTLYRKYTRNSDQTN